MNLSSIVVGLESAALIRVFFIDVRNFFDSVLFAKLGGPTCWHLCVHDGFAANNGSQRQRKRRRHSARTMVQIAAQLEVAHQGTQGDLPPSVRRKGGDLQDRWSDNPAA